MFRYETFINLIFSPFCMKHSVKVGFSFGLTSGVITTLGLMVGLNSGTNSKLAVLGGIFTIAIADAFSDALGIHISEESEGKHSHTEVWQSTISTFICKFLFASMFIIPVVFLSLKTAIVTSIIAGLLIITGFSYHLAKKQKTNPLKVIGEHILIAVVVIILTHLAGKWISTFFI